MRLLFQIIKAKKKKTQKNPQNLKPLFLKSNNNNNVVRSGLEQIHVLSSLLEEIFLKQGLIP